MVYLELVVVVVVLVWGHGATGLLEAPPANDTALYHASMTPRKKKRNRGGSSVRQKSPNSISRPEQFRPGNNVRGKSLNTENRYKYNAGEQVVRSGR